MDAIAEMLMTAGAAIVRWVFGPLLVVLALWVLLTPFVGLVACFEPGEYWPNVLAGYRGIVEVGGVYL